MSYNPYVQQGYYQQPQQQTRKNIALKKSFGGGLYLIAVILNTLILVLSIVSIFAPAASLEMILQQFGSQFGLSQSEINEAIGMMSNFYWIIRASAITACILPALSVLGMWLIWGNSKKEDLPVGTAGFTILKILVILDLIGVCMIGIVILIAMIPAIVGGSALDQYLDINVSATALIILFFVIMIAALVLVIIYYAKLLGIYTAAKDIGRLGVTSAKVSMFVIVINFLGLIFQLISIAVSLLTLDFLGAGSNLFGLLAVLFETIVFIKFRNAIEEQKAANPPAVQQPVNNPYQPYQSPVQQQYNNYNAQMQAQQAMQQQSQPYAHPYPAPQQPYGYQQNQYQQRPYQQQQQAFQQYNNYNAQAQAQQQMQQQAQQAYQQQSFQPQQTFQQAQSQPQAPSFQPQAQAFQPAAQEVQEAATGFAEAAQETAETAQGFVSETVTPTDVIDE